MTEEEEDHHGAAALRLGWFLCEEIEMEDALSLCAGCRFDVEGFVSGADLEMRAVEARSDDAILFN